MAQVNNYDCSNEHHRWDTRDRCDVSHRSDPAARTQTDGTLVPLTTYFNCSRQPCPNREVVVPDVPNGGSPADFPQFQYPSAFDRPALLFTQMQNQLNQLTTSMLQFTQHQNTAPARGGQTQNITVTSRDAIAKPQPYSGECGPDAQRYIGQVQLYCNMAGISVIYERISVALSYLKEDALIWATPFLTEAATTNAFLSFPDWNTFVNTFYAHFSHANDKEAATAELDKLCDEGNPDRNSRTVSKYEADFASLCHDLTTFP